MALREVDALCNTAQIAVASEFKQAKEKKGLFGISRGAIKWLFEVLWGVTSFQVLVILSEAKNLGLQDQIPCFPRNDRRVLPHNSSESQSNKVVSTVCGPKVMPTVSLRS